MYGYLHIIDHFARFSIGNTVKTKKSSDNVNCFIHSWISVCGPPWRLYSDKDGEFNNKEFRNMTENFNIEMRTTAGYSPWSKGQWEGNQIHTNIIQKGK